MYLNHKYVSINDFSTSSEQLLYLFEVYNKCTNAYMELRHAYSLYNVDRKWNPHTKGASSRF
jgi:hypothetical protein